MSVVIERPESDSTWLNRKEFPFAPRNLDVEGGRMTFVDEGSGEPVLFLHGWPTWSYLWRRYILELRDSHRCIAPDMIGFGLSEKPPAFSQSPAIHARNIAKLVRSLDLRDITLVLHDFGGPIGLAFAVDHPELVKRIVLMNTWCWDLAADEQSARLAKALGGPIGKLMTTRWNLPERNLRAQFADRAKLGEPAIAAYAGPLRDKAARTGAWSLARQLGEAGPWFDEIWHCRQVLESIPMQFLWGMKDGAFGERCLNRFWHAFPLAEVERYETAGHCLPEEKTGEVLRAIRMLLADSRKPYLA